MNKIFSIHPLTYFTMLLAVTTSHFKIYLSFMLLIIIHELGHVLAAMFFKWKINKIVILPLGALTKFDELINKPLKEEFIIASMGIIFQLIFYLLFLRNNEVFFYCNLLIIIFNLLPIYPLDGSKILNIFLNKITSFKNSYLVSLYLSFVLIILIFIVLLMYKDIVFIIAFIPLLIGLINEYKTIDILLNKFYLERYLYNFKFNKIKTINSLKIEKMKRDYQHLFKKDNECYEEKEILGKLFDKQRKMC